MDKVIDTPRTNFVAHASGDSEWDRSINRFGRMMAHACILERELTASRKETDILTGAVLDLREKLAEQKEHYRVLEEEMLVLGDERNAATRDAERYRWLRKQVTHIDFTPIAQVVWKRQNDPNEVWVNLVDGYKLDSKIDAAIKEKK